MQIWDPESGHPEKVDTGTDMWEKASSLHLADKYEEAEKIYIQLLEQNYDNPGLMATIGSLYTQMKQWGLGIHFLQTAIDKGMDQPDAYTNLATAYQRAGQYDRAKAYFEKSIAGESTPEALANYTGSLLEAGNPKKCIEICEKAIAGNPDLPIAHWNLALTLLGEGEWARAWDEHEWGLKPKGLREDRIIADLPWWDGTPGKTVIVYGEQGLGDEIMFASMLPDLLKTNPVILECHRRLANLFRNSFPQIEVYGTREERNIDWFDNQAQYRIAIGSLGKFYRRTPESFPGTPYLKSDSLPKDGKFRVGISWKGGGAKLGRVQKRSIPLNWWKPLLTIPNIEFVSLQYSDEHEELDVMEALGHKILRMDEYARAEDIAETAKLVKSCDLVISVCTSVIHLAGALGVRCWVATPCYPAWRYQNRGPMPWYRSVRLYRSPTPDQMAWKLVIDRMAADLDVLVNHKDQNKLRAVG